MSGPRTISRASAERGFTFIEIMISLTVLTVGALALAQALLQGHRQSESIQHERVIRSRCQTMLMELRERPWGSEDETASIEWLKARDAPLRFVLDEFPKETGQITVTDATTSFPEKLKYGKVYRIDVKFRGRTFHSYVDNVP